MIQFALKCAEGHRFDSWFQSGAAYDKLHAAGMINCAVCNTTRVEKVLMAPAVRAAKSAPETEVAGQQTAPEPKMPLSGAHTPQEQALQELKRHVEENSEYVGSSFASKAREMHEGTAPQTSIYGEARIDEARALLEDGVPVLPLPFRPNSKNN